MTDTHAKESRQFEAEVSQILQLMIHSLYSNKEIFLRELISNASDACDKLRFEAISNDALYEGDSELAVVITADKDAKTLTISDNGIGMSHDEVVNNIGTIARSGTKAFLDSMTGDQKKDSHLIGQFGVGFYSSFIVADKVTVVTRRAGEAGATRWESEGKGSYTIESAERAGRGTDIILHLREGEEEFLDDWRVRGIVKKYSDNIELPVKMLEYVPPVTEDDKDEDGNSSEQKEPEPKTPELEVINSAKAFWTRPKSELDDDGYKEFYKTVAHDWQDPLTWSHNKVEGNLEYTSLLYIPSQAPFDLFEREQKHGIKLYVQRVFIMDENKDLMPNYLRFVKGLVDSNDLPLNVSREILQSNKVIDSIRAGSVKKVLGMIESLAKNDAEKFAQFWSTFGQVIKEGPVEDRSNQERILKLCRFASTHADTSEQTVSLDDYISRMSPDQDTIYYITADSFNAAKNSPHLEAFRAKGIEVLLMSDRVDEWMMAQLQEFDGKKFVSVAKGELELTDEEKAENEKEEEQAKPLIERIKTVLGDKVDDVRVSSRLTTSPACVVMGEHEMALHMQQLLKQAGQAVPDSKPSLEVNIKHALVDKMDKEPDEDRFADLVDVLFGQAIIAEGGQLDDPAGFVKKLNTLLL